MKNIFIILSLFVCFTTYGQSKTKKVLFLGNSYTYVNDLPKMIADIAHSTGNSLVYDGNTPGGYSIGNHSLDTTSLNKIMLGKWDFVVLQGQSYELTSTTPDIYPYPYARKLDSIINQYNNNCAETVYYMTWGRKNGDPSSCPTLPYFCTYWKMDSVIQQNYRWMADTTNAIISPVGAVWRHIRKNYPLIDLYQSDESHPSLAGTFAAACCFYATIYRKNPALSMYNPGLTTIDADNIRDAVRKVVYDSLLKWHIGEYDSLMKIKCPTTSIKEEDQPLLWSIGPNPVTNLLTIKLAHQFDKESIQIYNSMGVLLEELDIVQSTELNVAHYPSGLYFIRSKSNSLKGYKFIKN